jgi:hypothetical protein
VWQSIVTQSHLEYGVIGFLAYDLKMCVCIWKYDSVYVCVVCFQAYKIKEKAAKIKKAKWS